MEGLRRRERLLRAAPVPRRRRVARIRPGTLPGTLEAPESAAGEAPRISVIGYGPEAHVERTVERIEDALAEVLPGRVSWINVEGLGQPEVLTRLGERFGLHPMALEDAMNVPQRPKVERFDTYFLIVLRMVRLSQEVEDEQVSLFFGQDWVVTVQERADWDVFDPVRDAIRQRRGRVRDAGADYLAYLLLDAVVDAYFPVLERVIESVEALEDDALDALPETLPRIQRARRNVLTLRRAVWPLREEIAVLQRADATFVAAATGVFLRDSYDHAVQALEVIESLRESLTSVMEVHLSAQNQRLNSVMKVLTVIATLFIPLTFIASIYGMNFAGMPELGWRWGYPGVLGLMALTAAGMLLYFRRRGWW
ncbi:MAG: magnesium and cobalt transport protein CorA [Candidatus Rokubacteria bacterium RIFCSPHIGHO2_12_FULL_73_22]|nr:MAG: magnesium and cobalt transport protein CorA [Candidatus Rokubacteria bacterium RIFCSPHIGHO2_02_FULL_73_26]OGL02741.1 MAG: magnesium and cobalt transport protein CorA [Candidatus Rokubacteria bacterium RIFCSPHIGHO2_12_FULL_73_22]OGL09306.1 MAG: magnesium and cobalt transport protein CorA [Candidatus Rokubacteria bacterium RIFCSPLOWO2_02_FULL_73_56]OGL29151.1 MAG: magnesium and cobalt transport protein CorA [Candidatus Rokubacteria bacterium RIFCSPLOWO2_12_FULL_73_47]